jgi:hypothetical protein
MTDPNLIESKLCSTTNAMLVDRETKNNRFHYRLIFDENIGWDWFEKQVSKVQVELGVKIEPYKMEPANSFMALEVRELERREGIDESQSDLAEFEA